MNKQPTYDGMDVAALYSIRHAVSRHLSGQDVDMDEVQLYAMILDAQSKLRKLNQAIEGFPCQK
jgi:hypothetical protein